MAVYKEAQDLINIGAYKAGSNPEIDRSIALNKPMEQFLQQKVSEFTPFDQTLDQIFALGSSG